MRTGALGAGAGMESHDLVMMSLLVVVGEVLCVFGVFQGHHRTASCVELAYYSILLCSYMLPKLLLAYYSSSLTQIKIL